MKGSSLFRPLCRILTIASLLVALVSRIYAQTGLPPVSALTVNIVAPTNGAVFIAPANIQITADLKDYGAYPDRIAFYAGTNLLVSLILDPIGPSETNGLVIPVQYTWSNAPVGAYTLTAVATDTRGTTVTSAPVNITVTSTTPPVPVVTIIATDPIASVCTNFPCVMPATAFAKYCSGTNTATFLVRRVGDTNHDLAVDYSIGGTASNGVDYATLPGYVTIPAGQRYSLITIVPRKAIHASAQPFLTVILALTEPPSPVATPPPYIIGWPGKAEAIILQDCNVPWPVTGILPDASFHVCLPGTNGMNFCLQISSNLINWVPLCTNTVVKGSIQFVDPEANTNSNRYYRAVPVPGPAIY
jgi:Bacterial Ig domain